MSKILIIEQDVFFGDVLNQRIKKDGYQTLVINNGAVAVEQMGLYKPDLVLLDMEISTADGYKILENKSKSPATANIPLIMISPSGDLGEIRKAVDLGVKDYMVKAQLNLEDLMVKVKAHLSMSTDNTGSVDGKGPLVGKKVMWVEDDQFLSDLISRKLSKQGCKLLYAGTGEDALKVLETEVPDIILLDILLPGINGFDVFEQMKNNPRVKDVPVIVLSNFSQQSQIDRAKQLGAARFLIKATIVLDDLVKEIVAVLAEKR
ncbi:MAG: response regulator [Candidatus Paceibacterota bacterium]